MRWISDQFQYLAVYRILKLSGRVSAIYVFYIKQQKSLKNRQKQNILNFWYYGNKLVTIHTYLQIDGRTDGNTCRSLDGQTDIWIDPICIVIKNCIVIKS